jgi:hypothetical protein
MKCLRKMRLKMGVANKRREKRRKRKGKRGKLHHLSSLELKVSIELQRTLKIKITNLVTLTPRTFLLSQGY